MYLYMSAVVSKSTIMRLIEDIKEITKNPLENQGIYYKHDETNMLVGYAMIIGPDDTPYQKGFYFFKFNFPTNYPLSPPKVEYMTNDGHTRFNPNLYRNGKVCLSVLNTWKGDSWTGCQTISSVLLHLCTTLNKEPLCNEPGVSRHHKDYKSYNSIINYKNYEVAILGIIQKKSYIYPEIADHFKDEIKTIITKNLPLIISNLEQLVIDNPNVETFWTSLYNMKVNVNYKEILSECQVELKKITSVN